MGDRVQLGIRVDEQVASEFRDAVEDRKGQLRGVLGDELEKAMRHYINHGTTVTADDELAVMREQLQRVEAALGTVPTDGGTDTVDADPHTHAPSRVEAAATEKPEPNAATEKKVRYLAEQLREREGEGFEQVPKKRLKEIVKEEYGFRRDTATRYVDELADYFELKQHPKADEVYCTPEGYNKVIDRLTDDEEQ